MLGWMNYYSRYSDLAWALFAFPVLAAIALLTLLPAASTPPWKEFKSGTPWKWPFYPWSLFVYLTIGVAIRAWWLTIAFEPAKGPDAYFRPYFLLPLVLAWSALVLEMGQVRRSKAAISAALLIPLSGLIIGFPGPGQNPVEVVFLDRLTQAIGSPAQLTVWSLLGFYGWAWLRREQVAECFLISLGLLAAVVGPETLDWSTLRAPQPLVLGIAALAIVGRAILLESTWRAGLAGAAMVVAVRMGGLDSSALMVASLWFWQWHAPIVALFAIIAIFNDELATILRSLAWRATPCLAIVAAVTYPWTMSGLLQSCALRLRDGSADRLHSSLGERKTSCCSGGRFPNHRREPGREYAAFLLDAFANYGGRRARLARQRPIHRAHRTPDQSRQNGRLAQRLELARAIESRTHIDTRRT